MTRRGTLLLVALAAACSDEKPHAKTATLAEANVAIEVKDAGPDWLPPAGSPPPPGTTWLYVPGLGIEMAVPPGTTIDPGGTERATHLHLGGMTLELARSGGEGEGAGAAADGVAVRARVVQEEAPTAFQVDVVMQGEFRFEYSGEKAGARTFGFRVRRVVGGLPIDCSGRDGSARSARAAAQACASMRLRPADAPAEEPEAAARGGGLPPGKEWLPVPDLGVDVAVSSGAEVARQGGGEVVVRNDTSELRLRRAAGAKAADRDAIIERLTREGGGRIGLIVNHSEGEEFRVEYVIKDRKSGQPRFGMVMRRLIDGHAIDCTSRGPETGSTAMALEACHAMRATPH